MRKIKPTVADHYNESKFIMGEV